MQPIKRHCSGLKWLMWSGLLWPVLGHAATPLGLSASDAQGVLVIALVFVMTSLAEVLLLRTRGVMTFVGLIGLASAWAYARLALVVSPAEDGLYLAFTGLLAGGLCVFARSLMDLTVLQPGLGRLSYLLAALPVGMAVFSAVWPGWSALVLTTLVALMVLLAMLWMAYRLNLLQKPEMVVFSLGALLFFVLHLLAMVEWLTHDWLAFGLVLMGVACKVAVTAHFKSATNEEMLAKDQLIIEHLGQIEFLQSTELVLNQRLEKRDLKINTQKELLAEFMQRQRHLEKQLVQSEELIRQFSYYDSLTGLPNRALFVNQLEQWIEHAESAHPRQVLLLGMLDIDHFGEINAAFGPEVADTLLSQVAKRLLNILPVNTLIARLGGDEFAFVLLDIGSAELAKGLIHRWLAELSLPFVINPSITVTMHFTFGMTVYPDNGQSASQLMQSVEHQVNEAKSAR